MKRYKQKNGYIALITVLIVGALALSFAISTAILAIDQGKNSLLIQNSAEADSLARSCAEKALIELKTSVTYGGNETINLGNGQCQILPIEDLGDESRLIKVLSNVNSVVKRQEIQISQINPTITIDYWKDVSSF